MSCAWIFESGIGRERIMGRFGQEEYQVLDYFETPDATISAVQFPGDARGLIIDGFQAASELEINHYMEWMGRLPMMLHEDPRRALVICMGTGQTSNAVRREGIAHLDIVDINARVFGVAHHFPRNEGVLQDERVKTIVMDGRAYMRRTTNMYDVITLEPMPPNFAGVNALYSKEFYELAKARLAPGGTISQWVSFYLVTPYLNASVVRTFASVFPNSLLWVDPVSRTGIVVGRNGDEPLIGSQWPGLARPTTGRTLDKEAIRNAVALKGAAFDRYISSGEIITDDNQLLAYGRDVQASLFLGRKLVSLNEALVNQAKNAQIKEDTLHIVVPR